VAQPAAAPRTATPPHYETRRLNSATTPEGTLAARLIFPPRYRFAWCGVAGGYSGNHPRTRQIGARQGCRAERPLLWRHGRRLSLER
jgi:hypothetical protein